MKKPIPYRRHSASTGRSAVWRSVTVLLTATALVLPSAAQDCSDKVRTDILPWVESVGQLFGLSEAALDSLQWSDDLLSACTQEQYDRMATLVQNPALYYCPTGWYRLTASNGSLLYLTGDNPQLGRSATYGEAVSAVVRMERCRDGGFYLQMQGRYLGSPSKSTAIPMHSEPTKYYPVVKTPGGSVALTTRRGNYAALHSSATSIVGGTLSDAASYWTIAPCTSMEVTASVTTDGMYYHTFYAPFATTISAPLQAFVMAEHEGKAVATEELTEIPALTPVLLRSTEKTLPLTLADDDHADVAGNVQLRNTMADASFEAFNNVFLLRSGDKNNYTFYREYVNTTDKLYFWQQALVILMVEDRYDFRGDHGVASLITDLLDAFMAQEGTINTQGISDWSWNEYNDDLLWAGLAFVRGYLITGQTRFLTQAKWAWNRLYTRGWDDTLGGGIWWSVDKEEKSGLSNNPAVCMAAYLYDATGEQQYLDKAIAIYDWVIKKLRHSDGAVSEKIDADGTVSTSYNVYNMGTFVEGTAALYRLTGNTKYRGYARATIKYVMVNRTDANGIVSHSSKYDGTYQSEFARGMAFWLQAYPDDWQYKGYMTPSQKRITYYDWMRKNADAAWATRNRSLDISNCEWNAVTPLVPANGKESKGWECDACVSSVVMLQVTPEVLPGSAEEVYVDIDDHSADYAYHPADTVAPTPDTYTVALDAEGVMRVTKPLTVVCVGNSITDGYGNTSRRMAWPAQMNRLIGASYDVQNYGVSGTTMGRQSGVSYWDTSSYTKAKNADPDILIIALGTNDADPNRWDQWGSTFKADYLAMVEEFRAGGRNPIIYCTLAPPKFPTATDKQNRYIEQKLIPLVKEIAGEIGARILDFHTPMMDQQALFPDKLHPSDDGAAMLADIAQGVLTEGQVLTGEITLDKGTLIDATTAVVTAGATATLTPTAPAEGSWTWTGPDNYTSAERVVTLTNIQRGGTYTVQYTDGEGYRSALNFTLALEGTTAGKVTPYVQVSGGSWQQATELVLMPGQSLNFGPQCGNNSGTWVWRGPDGFFAATREASVTTMTPARAGEYGVTYTDAQGRQSTAVWNIIVEGELDCPDMVPYINYNNSWTQTTTMAVSAGSTVKFGPQPTDGTWSWTGPDGFTARGREVSVSAFSAAKAGEYIATYTNEAGCCDEIVFTLTLK